jgi:sterol desaturase/sphingolipid hydroxylase (fatty acid hydroxylase superfamily)
MLGIVLGLTGLAYVLVLRIPGTFATPQMQELYGHPFFRLALHAVLLFAFACAALSLVLRKGKALGTFGAGVTLAAVCLGGSRATALVPDPSPLFLGLDWFVLNVLLTGLLFIPFERLFPLRPEQSIFRNEWREDLFYYLVSSLLVQVLTFLSFLPAQTLGASSALVSVRAWVGALPFPVQFVAIMFLTDFTQYWVHRTFHQIPFLWKFHAVHHSAQSMDWMAGARMHFLEILLLRSVTVIPTLALGFGELPIQSYILVVYLYSTLIHANLHWRFRFIESFLVTPRFHHWHHGIEDEAIDVNFAIHFPWLDRLFGTHHLPKDQWPSGYGVQGHPVPTGYWKQFLYPFRRDRS